MPCHEIREGFDLTRRFYHAQTSQRPGDLCQPARNSEDQIGFNDGEDRGHKERKTKRDASLYPKLCQRAIHHGLLTIKGFDQCVRQLQILLECKATGSNLLSGANKTNKIQIENQLVFQRGKDRFCTKSDIDTACRNILIGLSSPGGYFESCIRRRLAYPLEEHRQKNRGSVV